jgi:hypothetical protein
MFSALLPHDLDPRTTHWWKLAESMGAQCFMDGDESVQSHQVTHVVTRSGFTERVRQFSKNAGVFLVREQWLTECFLQKARVLELEYSCWRHDTDDPMDVAELLYHFSHYSARFRDLAANHRQATETLQGLKTFLSQDWHPSREASEVPQAVGALETASWADDEFDDLVEDL